MTVSEFEDAVWALEGVRIVIRAPAETIVGDYDFRNAANERWGTTQWLRNRVEPRVDGNPISVLQGDGEEPHGRVILRTLRASYA
ncbi:MAG: hypothetical protein ACR2KU_05500 [Gammaproteobacteria bacterium]|nr:hypothetical protein [Gammaproteobacteria bacterium]